jgi:exosortase family protein XrtF
MYRRKQRRDVIKLIYNHKYVARIIEGCNAISIIILFISFVVSFSGKKTNITFIFGGSVLVYVLNVMRIAMLSVLMYHFPGKCLSCGVLFSVYLWSCFHLVGNLVSKFSLYAKILLSHKVRVTIGFVLVVFA